MQHTGEAPDDPLELRLYPGANGLFWLYEDEGDSYNYTKGASSRIPMHWDNRRQVLRIEQRQGSFPGMIET
ncbi:MAG: DUF5110 domain-containing protein, partial [Armatimonadota bacterium]|nr:DUF5110 domain-containing protein [Armatimonadota bacterium]